MIASPIPAHFNNPTHFWYFFSSPPDVIIKNPAYNAITNATKDNIPSTQLMAVLTVLIKLSLWNELAPATPALYDKLSVLHHPQSVVNPFDVSADAAAEESSWALTKLGKIATQATANIHRNAPTNNFFIFMCNNK